MINFTLLKLQIAHERIRFCLRLCTNSSIHIPFRVTFSLPSATLGARGSQQQDVKQLHADKDHLLCGPATQTRAWNTPPSTKPAASFTLPKQQIWNLESIQPRPSRFHVLFTLARSNTMRCIYPWVDARHGGLRLTRGCLTFVHVCLQLLYPPNSSFFFHIQKFSKLLMYT